MVCLCFLSIDSILRVKGSASKILIRECEKLVWYHLESNIIWPAPVTEHFTCTINGKNIKHTSNFKNIKHKSYIIISYADELQIVRGEVEDTFVVRPH